jgi:DUF4097 and DUF4098 domain-containing protein YvlB
LSVHGYTQEEADANLAMMSVGEELQNGVLKLCSKYDDAGLLDMSPGCTFVLRVPRQTSLTLDSHNGSIEARGTKGSLSMATHNGGIVARAETGMVRAETHNGSVRLELGSAGRLDGEITTHNGSVDLALAEGTSTLLEASTHNGDVEAHSLQDAKVGGRSVRGRFGDGQGRLSVTTHNGNVTIR